MNKKKAFWIFLLLCPSKKVLLIFVFFTVLWIKAFSSSSFFPDHLFFCFLLFFFFRSFSFLFLFSYLNDSSFTLFLNQIMIISYCLLKQCKEMIPTCLSLEKEKKGRNKKRIFFLFSKKEKKIFLFSFVFTCSFWFLVFPLFFPFFISSRKTRTQNGKGKPKKQKKEEKFVDFLSFFFFCFILLYLFQIQSLLKTL